MGMGILNIPSGMRSDVMEQGEEAEARKKKAFWVSILFVLLLTCSVVGIFGILQLVKKDDDESVENGNSTSNATTNA